MRAGLVEQLMSFEVCLFLLSVTHCAPDSWREREREREREKERGRGEYTQCISVNNIVACSRRAAIYTDRTHRKTFVKILQLILDGVFILDR